MQCIIMRYGAHKEHIFYFINSNFTCYVSLGGLYILFGNIFFTYLIYKIVFLLDAENGINKSILYTTKFR